MKQSYDRFDKVSSHVTDEGHYITIYQTSNIRYQTNNTIDVLFRWLRVHGSIGHKFILPWNPLHPPTVGHWIQHDANLQTITLLAKCGPGMRRGDLKIVWEVSSHYGMLSACRGISDYMGRYNALMDSI